MDSTGFSTTLKTDWVNFKFGTRKGHWEWKKLHAICGNRSNVIASVRITEGRANDSPYFQELVGDASKNFSIGEVCADPAYTSKSNVGFVAGLGAAPFLKPKSNFRTRRGSSLSWARMLRMWRENETEFRKHYHLRSNIESTFSSVKRKFGGNMRTKKDVSQRNELLSKVCCHNGSVLVSSIFEVGVEAKWS